MPRRRIPEARTTLESMVMFFGLLLLWCGGLTLIFMALEEDFLHYLTHPLHSSWGWYGAWGMLMLYALLSIPVFPIYNRLDDWWEQRRREEISRSRNVE